MKYLNALESSVLWLTGQIFCRFHGHERDPIANDCCLTCFAMEGEDSFRWNDLPSVPYDTDHWRDR